MKLQIQKWALFFVLVVGLITSTKQTMAQCNLIVPNYLRTVTDAACDSSAVIAILGVTDQFGVQQNVSNLNFTWSNGFSGNGSAFASQNNLSVGDYFVTITDNGSSCMGFAAFNVDYGPANNLLGGVSDIIGEDCGSAAITAFPANGTPPYFYSWSNNDTTQSTVLDTRFSDHYVTITDAAGCTRISKVDQGMTFLYPKYNSGSIASNPTITVCPGDTANFVFQSDFDEYYWDTTTIGSVQITSVYQQNQFDEEVSFSVTGEGFVIFEAEHWNTGCTLTDTVEVTSELDLWVEMNEAKCHDDTVNIEIEVGGASTHDQPLNWSVTGGVIGVATSNDDATIEAHSDSIVYLVVQSPDGCAVTDTFTTPVAPDSVQANISFTVNNQVMVSPSGGTAPYGILWNGYGVSQSVFPYTPLYSGTHIVVVEDANGCESIDTIQWIATSTYRVGEVQFSFGPNPATNQIVFDGLVADEVQVFNSLGQQLFVVRDSIVSVDVSMLSNGVYQMVIFKDGSSITVPVMIAR